MRAPMMIVARVFFQQSTQVPLVHDDHIIEALVPYARLKRQLADKEEEPVILKNV